MRIQDLNKVKLSKYILEKLNFKIEDERFVIDINEEQLYLRPCAFGGYIWGVYCVDDDLEYNGTFELYSAPSIKYVHELLILFKLLSGSNLDIRELLR